MSCLESAAAAIASPLVRVDASVFTWEERLCELESDASASESQCLKLLDVTVARARREQSPEWAAMALRAAVRLAACDGGRYRDVAELDAMRLRVEFIAKQGALAGDPVLDVDSVVRWFLQTLPFSAETARAKAVQPTSVDLRTLRRLKSRLNLLKQLAECGELPRQPQLNAWLELDELLP